MFQQRQINDVYQLVEVSQTPAFTPGAVGNNSVLGSSQACTLGGTTNPATFAIGDELEVFPTTVTATNGIHVAAAPTSVAGTAIITFVNGSGGGVTPVSGVYKIVAKRITPTLT